MADIINLRMARKAKTRAEADRTATANRAKFGRTKAEKQAAELESAALAKRLEGARLDEPD
jgi:hypothetical protein